MPKIVAYAIAKNEDEHVEEWHRRLREADEIIVCDSGSRDHTVEHLRDLGCTVHNITIDPWRFDLARNTCLALVPNDADICVVIDLDEELSEGWRHEVESLWTHATHRLCVNYTEGAEGPEDEPHQSISNSRIHRRNGFHWNYPCHEVLEWHGDGPDDQTPSGISVVHKQNLSKERQYLKILRRGYLEYNFSPRTTYYYGRELHNVQDWGNAALVLERFMRFQIWDRFVSEEEHTNATNMLCMCYAQMQLWPEAVKWGEIAIQLGGTEHNQNGIKEALQKVAGFQSNPQQFV
jgi:glycosyltransferase involved in cell wall biosynthesis